MLMGLINKLILLCSQKKKKRKETKTPFQAIIYGNSVTFAKAFAFPRATPAGGARCGALGVGGWVNHPLKRNPEPLGPSRRHVLAEPLGLTDVRHPDCRGVQSEAALAEPDSHHTRPFGLSHPLFKEPR